LFTAFGTVKDGVRTREERGVVLAFSKPSQIRNEDKGKVVFMSNHHTMEAYMVLGDRAPYIFDRLVISITLRTF
jgi:hypothetical protein